MPEITITDKPCGHGKSTDLIDRMSTLGKFLIISPLIDEVERFAAGARKQGIEVHTPTDEKTTKTADIESLINEGRNICTTHAMYLRLAELARRDNSPLSDYTIVIDEVPTPLEPAPKIKTADFTLVLQGLGLVTIDPDTRQVWPTMRWHQIMLGGAEDLYPNVYETAKSGRLYTQDGNLFILAIPVELVKAGRRLEILTFLSQGSLIRAYLDSIGATYRVNQLVPEAERRWREKIRSLVTIEGFANPDGVSFTHSGQTERTTEQAGKRVSVSIKNHFSREWKDVDPRKTMVTCAFDNWHGDKKRTAPGIWSHCYGKWTKDKRTGFWSTTGIQWVANTTRGSNRWIDCAHLIYLYDQRPNPNVTAYLGVRNKAFDDAFALTELVQWMFRSAIRKRDPEPITIALPTERMRNLLINWLDQGTVSSAKPRPDHKCLVNTKTTRPKKRKLTPRRAA